MLPRYVLRVTRRARTYRWDLLGDVDGLGNGQLALLDRTLEIDVFDLLAQAGLGADEADQAILDN